MVSGNTLLVVLASVPLLFFAVRADISTIGGYNDDYEQCSYTKLIQGTRNPGLVTFQDDVASRVRFAMASAVVGKTKHKLHLQMSSRFGSPSLNLLVFENSKLTRLTRHIEVSAYCTPPVSDTVDRLIPQIAYGSVSGFEALSDFVPEPETTPSANDVPNIDGTQQLAESATDSLMDTTSVSIIQSLPELPSGVISSEDLIPPRITSEEPTETYPTVSLDLSPVATGQTANLLEIEDLTTITPVATGQTANLLETEDLTTIAPEPAPTIPNPNIPDATDEAGPEINLGLHAEATATLGIIDSGITSPTTIIPPVINHLTSSSMASRNDSPFGTEATDAEITTPPTQISSTTVEAAISSTSATSASHATVPENADSTATPTAENISSTERTTTVTSTTVTTTATPTIVVTSAPTIASTSKPVNTLLLQLLLEPQTIYQLLQRP